MVYRDILFACSLARNVVYSLNDWSAVFSFRCIFCWYFAERVLERKKKFIWSMSERQAQWKRWTNEYNTKKNY